jgi:hypothetical protein
MADAIEEKGIGWLEDELKYRASIIGWEQKLRN